MDIIGEATAPIQHLSPGSYVWVTDEKQFVRVAEFPVITGQAVFVNLIGGGQVSGPLDSEVTVPVWA